MSPGTFDRTQGVQAPRIRYREPKLPIGPPRTSSRQRETASLLLALIIRACLLFPRMTLLESAWPHCEGYSCHTAPGYERRTCARSHFAPRICTTMHSSSIATIHRVHESPDFIQYGLLSHRSRYHGVLIHVRPPPPLVHPPLRMCVSDLEGDEVGPGQTSRTYLADRANP
jgi:hypothetical protein